MAEGLTPLYAAAGKAREEKGERTMQLMEERIRRNGIVRAGNVLKVDSFLNHQMDIDLFNEMGQEFYRLFGEEHVTKIVTIEASGIGIACVAARFCPCACGNRRKNRRSKIWTAMCIPAPSLPLLIIRYMISESPKNI